MAKQTIFIGEVFNSEKCGPFKIIEYVDANNITVRFTNTGTTVTTQGTHIRKGKVKDVMVPSVEGVGFIGIGPFSPSYQCNDRDRAVSTPIYSLWSNMLCRCYNRKYQMHHLTYIGCEVAPRWHNFQNFCWDVKQLDGYEQWSNYQMGVSDAEYQLDKDKLVDGNKVYGPETCCFITATENYLLALTKHLSQIQNS